MNDRPQTEELSNDAMNTGERTIVTASDNMQADYEQDMEEKLMPHPFARSQQAGRSLNDPVPPKAADQSEWSVAPGQIFDTSKTVQKWADPAMFTAAPIDPQAGPQVHLLSMTPDPLGAIAAACMGYEGRFVDDLSEITDEERLHYFEQVQKTHLKAPFEFVQFHFSISGVTRGFTHQMVRQRTATYVQESTRFAVKEDMPIGLPPSIAGMTEEQLGMTLPDTAKGRLAGAWHSAVESIQEAYQYCVDNGMPAEDARGLLPTNLLTRIQYRTDLRSLIEHGGNRLCTQAQFEWRLVFAKIAQEIRQFGENQEARNAEMWSFCSDSEGYPRTAWQFEKLADVFRPVCYLTGKCEFKASFDRACSIRNRVDANAQVGRPSRVWHEEMDHVQGNPIVSGVGPQSVVRNEQSEPVFIGAISPAEWLLNPGAAR